jgi:hypothetical protein
VLVGNFVSYLKAKGASVFALEADKWLFSMKYQLLSVTIFGFLAMFACRHVNVLTSKSESLEP